MDLGRRLRADGFAIKTDGRAQYVDRQAPEAVSVLRISATKWAEAMTIAIETRPRPALLIGADGNGWALTSGGSGVVAYHLPESLAEPDPRQAETIAAAVAVLEEVATGTPKKAKRRTKAAADVPGDATESPQEASETPEATETPGSAPEAGDGLSEAVE